MAQRCQSISAPGGCLRHDSDARRPRDETPTNRHRHCESRPNRASDRATTSMTPTTALYLYTRITEVAGRCGKIIFK